MTARAGTASRQGDLAELLLEGSAHIRERAAMTQMTLHVGGMSCRRCVREVTARLRDVSGVGTVAADAATSTVRLGGVMAVADVLRAFVGTTYQPEIVANSDETATGKPQP